MFKKTYQFLFACCVACCVVGTVCSSVTWATPVPKKKPVKTNLAVQRAAPKNTSAVVTHGPVPKRKPYFAEGAVTAPVLSTKTATPAKTIAGMPWPKRKPAFAEGSVGPRSASPETIEWKTPKRSHTAAAGSQAASLVPASRTAGVNVAPVAEASGTSPVQIPGVGAASAPTRNLGGGWRLPDPVIVFFQENSLNLEADQTDILQHDVVQTLKEKRGLEIVIKAYAENGADARGLSEARAQALAKYLVRQGVDSRRIRLDAEGSNTRVSPKDRAEIEFDR